MKKFVVIIIVVIVSAMISYKFHSKIESFNNVIQAKFSSQPVDEIEQIASLKEHIKISISPENIDVLEKYVGTALEQNLIGEKEKKWLAASLEINSKKILSKLRLKGDNTDHIGSNKWSFKVKNDSAVFAIQHPKTRSYLYEWILHKAYREKGILTTNYDFVNVTLNEDYKGIYAKEEAINASYLKARNLPLSPILKFEEDDTWEEALVNKFVSTGTYMNSSISGYVKESSKGKIKEAIDKLRSFQSGKLNSLENNFNLELWAKYFAVTEVFGALHGARWVNIRFYYNPQTLKFDPVGYDASELAMSSIVAAAYRDDPRITEISNEQYLRGFFQNNKFVKIYNKELEEMLKNNFVTEVFESNKEQYQYLQKELKKEFALDNDWEKLLSSRHEMLEKVYTPYEPIRAFYNDSNNLLVGNKFFLPIELIKMETGKGEINLERQIIPQKSLKANLDYHLIPIGKQEIRNEGYVFFKILGQEKIFKTSIKKPYKL